ncbi:hypothetical protein DOTSEDRAFT_35535 [Dothistroma septosporum NZE10]|uniref:Uncharacterized protein n=1 Tax=Dothistroma septosporum (strain NZE10 / CBS 128990) TaxID=675120 RepID=M2Y4L2_DOTSN|nr:hypothetical protein DOTSEDRAFT_35535 [Dothistroma septosporum NZE10]
MAETLATGAVSILSAMRPCLGRPHESSVAESPVVRHDMPPMQRHMAAGAIDSRSPWSHFAAPRHSLPPSGRLLHDQTSCSIICIIRLVPCLTSPGAAKNPNAAPEIPQDKRGRRQWWLPSPLNMSSSITSWPSANRTTAKKNEKTMKSHQHQREAAVPSIQYKAAFETLEYPTSETSGGVGG